MKKQIHAEANVLDRVMYLLEENSVRTLMEIDSTFSDYVENLYSELHVKSMYLKNINMNVLDLR